MNCLRQDSWAFGRADRKPAAGRRVTATLAIVALVASFALGGCNRVPGLVSVSGKLTYDGGPWPKKGEIIFSPVAKTGDHPQLPAMAHVMDDGSFVAQTADSKGMMPGEYNTVIRCWLEPADEHHAGKSAIPERYGRPLTSGLKLTVPEGSPPMVVDWDIKSK